MEKLLSSRNYQDICPDTIKKEWEYQISIRKNAKEAEKAAKARLHALTGAFMSTDELKKAKKCLSRYTDGDENALKDALMLHSSTRERINEADELYARIAAFCPDNTRVLDAACGLNPLILGSKGYRNVTCCDIHGGALGLIKDWSSACGWNFETRCVDLSISVPEGEYSFALVMKLLPVLETDEKGSALRFLEAVNAESFVVTFPTKSLTGRNNGMEANYTKWFEDTVKQGFDIKDRFVLGSELVYFITKNCKTGVIR